MTPRVARLLVTILAGVAVCTNGCGHYRPALFADRPVVTVVNDDRPTRLPSRRTFDEREQLSDIYLRRPLFDVVRPLDFPTGGDVNAMDEVPTSTWYDPGQTAAGPSEPALAPPTLPLFALDDTPAIHEDALVVRDARGMRYELLADPPEKLGLLTGAEVLGGYLLRALGLRAPRAWMLGISDSAIISDVPKAAPRLERWTRRKSATVRGLRRVSATRWPNGIDVGIASDFSVRDDDPNDTVEHHDRRTLRATIIFAHWMAWSAFNVRSTRDVYVGKVGDGHLEHFLVGTSGAFGTQDLQADPVRDEAAGSVWWNLVTLGLSPPVVSPTRRSPFPSLGYLPSTLEPGSFKVSPPYSPFVRLTPPDEYWAAKRLVDAGDEALRTGIAAAQLPEDAARHLTAVLESRRRMLVAHAMSVVSPLEVTTVTGRSVLLRDRAIAAGVADARDTQYDIAFLDADGREQSARRRVPAAGELLTVALPEPLVAGLVVVEVRAVRGGLRAARACDVHVIADRGSARIIGLRH